MCPLAWPDADNTGGWGGKSNLSHMNPTHYPSSVEGCACVGDLCEVIMVWRQSAHSDN